MQGRQIQTDSNIKEFSSLHSAANLRIAQCDLLRRKDYRRILFVPHLVVLGLEL